jgi:hypothetical protein
VTEPRTLVCPACGNNDHFSVIESVLCNVGILPEISDEGTVVYDGNGSDVCWDSQTPVKSTTGYVLIHCNQCCEEWYDMRVRGTTD